MPGSGPKKKARRRLSANQLYVLELACSAGDTTRDCRGQSEHAGRMCTLYSLRRLGLLTRADEPTGRGRAVLAAGGVLAPADT